MLSMYETFGNEISYEKRRDKVVQFLENSTIAFPLPEASVDILTTMLLLVAPEPKRYGRISTGIANGRRASRQTSDLTSLQRQHLPRH